MSPRLAVPQHIPRPPYVDTGENPWFDGIQVHDGEVIHSNTCRDVVQGLLLARWNHAQMSGMHLAGRTEDESGGEVSS